MFIGLMVGVAVGLSGIGGAALSAPFLILLGVPPVNVVGSDLAFNAATKALGSILNLKRRNIAFPALKRLVAGSIPALILGSITIKQVKEIAGWTSLNKLTLISIGIVLVTVSIQLILTPRRKASPIKRTGDPRLTTLVGFAVALPLTLTSIGAGSLTSPYLMKTLSSPRKVTGTTILYGLIISSLATALHLNLGTVKPSIFIPMLAGSIPGVYLGVKFNDHLSLNKLRLTLSLLILASGLATLLKLIHP
ncbi:TPA: sulfite exporter TauE/SafE family protein [Candidatus Bathyarchaeota archaeon]|nr:sulfite exporter TauE/SafE family protein [Candidatus Bathyarchaeota archaeon]